MDCEPLSLDRRRVLLGLGALLALPAAAEAAPGSWRLGMQILAGARVEDPTVLALVLEGVAAEFGKPAVDALLAAVLQRDAASIVEPFDDPRTEAAARRFVEMIYTGEVPTGPSGKITALAFHQALAWQVLPFTKPPSVCGPGFGWWTKAPEVG